MFFGLRIIVFRAAIIRQLLQLFETKIDDENHNPEKGEVRLIRAELHLEYGIFRNDASTLDSNLPIPTRC